MNTQVFATPERIRILEAAVFQKQPVSVMQLANALHFSKGFVSKYLDLLARKGIVKRANGKFAVQSHKPFVKGIKTLLNLGNLELSFLKKYPFVKAVGLYGSSAKGENAEDSDTDLWVRMEEAPEEKKAALAAEFRRRIKNPKVLFLSELKLKKLKKEDELFYHALSFGSIVLYGAPNALDL